MKLKTKSTMSLLLCAIIFAFAIIAGGSRAEYSTPKGDVSGDGLIDSRDIALIQRHVLGLSILADTEIQAADLSDDNIVNSRDIAILQSLILYGRPTPKPTLTSTPTQQPYVTPTLPVTPDPNDPYAIFPLTACDILKGKVVVIDAGHGKGYGGVYETFYEHEYNLIYAELIGKSLKACGAEVIFTRPTAEMVNNFSRMAALNRLGLNMLCEYYEERLAGLSEGDPNEVYALVDDIEELKRLQSLMESIIIDESLSETYFLSPYDTANGRAVHPETKQVFEYLKDDYIQETMLFVSIHSNAAGNPGPLEVNGTVTFYMDNEYNKEYYTGYPVERNERLAQILLRRVSEAGGFNIRGCKVNDYFMIRETTIPAALLEVGFHTNDGDRAKILDEANRKRVSNAVVLSIAEYFGA